MNTEQTVRDDLTRIKGIGLTRQEWLRNAFKVFTFADLAALTPEQIERQLKAERQIASRGEIAAWINKAQELAGGSPSAGAATAVSSVASKQGNEQAEECTVVAATADWQASARFVVEFQTTVDEAIGAREQIYRTVASHLDLATDHLLGSKSWSGLQSEPLCTWMLEQVEQQPQPTPAGERLPTLKLPLPTAHAKITQVWFHQPPPIEMPRALYPTPTDRQGVIIGEQPFALAIAFDLTGLTAAELANKQPPYRVQAYLFNLTTGVSLTVGASNPATLSAGKLSYVAHLSCPALVSGIYRLRMVLSLEDRPPLVDYLELPLLQIV